MVPLVTLTGLLACTEVDTAGPAGDVAPDAGISTNTAPPPTVEPWIAGRACSASKMADIRAAATASRSSVVIDCDAVLDPTDRLTKRVWFTTASNGVHLDCRGATLSSDFFEPGDTILQIASRRTVGSDGVPTWTPVHDVTIENCVIEGGVRIWGMGKSGEAPDVRVSSATANHTAAARAAAPYAITLRNVTLRNGPQRANRTTLYVAPGVHDSLFEGLDISGGLGGIAVYFDAESTRNTLRRSTLHADSEREQLAVDGSSDNVIVENTFSHLQWGGIFLYRNCGEGGAARHATPSRNLIVNNTFNFDTPYSSPAVYLGSRSGLRNYCAEDIAIGFGSGLDDLDHATDNIVMQNQFVTSPHRPIVIGLVGNEGNHVGATVEEPAPPAAGAPPPASLPPGANVKVRAALAQTTGCFVGPSDRGFLASGASTAQISDIGDCRAVRCDAGVTTVVGTCSAQRVAFTCTADSNAGCSGTATCPAGSLAVTARAECNLEWTRLPPHAAPQPMGSLIVTRAPDDPGAGHCQVGTLDINGGHSWIDPLPDAPLPFGCQDYDRNGGECLIRGDLWCVATPAPAPTTATR